MPDKAPEKTPVTPDPITPSGTEDEVLRAAGLRALEAERRQNTERQQKIEELQRKLDDAEAEKLGEADKWKRKFENADAALKKYEQKAALDVKRVEIAKALEIEEYADLLAGEDEAALTAHAEKLKAKLSTGPKTPEPNPYLGQENPQGGDTDADALRVLGF